MPSGPTEAEELEYWKKGQIACSSHDMFLNSSVSGDAYNLQQKQQYQIMNI